MNYGRKMVTESLDFITLEKESLKLIQTKSGDRPCDITMTQNGNLVYTDPKSRTADILKNTQTTRIETSR